MFPQQDKWTQCSIVISAAFSVCFRQCVSWFDLGLTGKKKITRGGKLDESIVKLENTNTVFKLRTFMYRIFDKIIFERNLIFSIDLHEGSWISCFRAWYNRTLTTSSSQPLFVCVSVNCYCRALNQIGWKAKQAPFSWIYNCTTFRNISTVSLYTCTCKYWFNTWQDTVIILLPH